MLAAEHSCVSSCSTIQQAHAQGCTATSNNQQQPLTGCRQQHANTFSLALAVMSHICWCAMQAFAIQSYVTGEGPYANWSKHVADPFGYNLLTIVGDQDRLPTL